MVSWAHWKWILIIIAVANAFFLFDMGNVLNIGISLTSAFAGISVKFALAIANVGAAVILYKELT